MLACVASYGQDTWQDVLRADPYLADGYFIVSADQWQAKDLDHITVDIILAELQTNDTVQEQTIQQFQISSATYGKADLGFLTSMTDQQAAYYRLRGYNKSGTLMVDVDGSPRDCPGCGAWPEACRQTCNAPDYAWSLHLHSAGGQSYIELGNGIVNGTWLYFYVPQSQWGQFSNQYTPTALGYGYGWNELLNMDGYHDQVFHLNILPDDARDITGYMIPAGLRAAGGYAVAKHRGPWWQPGIATGTIALGYGDLCLGEDHLRTLFNADGFVQYTYSQYGLPSLTCNGMLVPGGSAVGWQQNWCNQITNTILEMDILEWTVSVISCDGDYTVINHELLSEARTVFVDHWGDHEINRVLTVEIGDGKDPKLVTVPRTPLEPGLYEFTIVKNDGTMIRQYQDFSAPLTITADFSSFVGINIYPVPVKGQEFAIDFDLDLPMEIGLSIVNNMGVPYFAKQLSFPVAGKNKFVVQMQSSWPSGIYHAIFQYGDGSSSSLNFTVAE